MNYRSLFLKLSNYQQVVHIMHMLCTSYPQEFHIFFMRCVDNLSLQGELLIILLKWEADKQKTIPFAYAAQGIVCYSNVLQPMSVR